MTRDRTFIVAEVADVIEAETLEAPTSHDLADSRRVAGRTPAPPSLAACMTQNEARKLDVVYF
jgi:hypothetical protein